VVLLIYSPIITGNYYYILYTSTPHGNRTTDNMATENASSAHSHIEKLRGDNFNTWRFQIGILLKSRGIYGHIDGSTVRGEKPEEQSKWDINDHKAQNFIVATVEKKHFNTSYDSRYCKANV